MGKSLIIVESPAKIKTLKKFLGKNYIFASSVGHIRDLPEKGFGIDVENDFEPQYQILPDKKDVIEKLKSAAKECDMVYLSPDPDREGEAIAWHIAALLPKKTKIKRAAFNAITKEAVQEALKHPQEINIALVNAQQARRLLDRIVGYKISPLLARKIRQRSSAGRVQSVALKIVVDREKEIESFVPVEYWVIETLLQDEFQQNPPFLARLYSIEGIKWEKEPIEGKEAALIPTKEDADRIVERLKKSTYAIASVEKKEKKRNPEPPFITSTLQQEASRHYRFSSSKTMSVAQTLYEGVDLDSEGAEGLITYMRTDSVRLAPEAIEEARLWIKEKYGEGYLPSSPKQYTRKKAAQDAHEAIRPTNLNHPPEIVKPYLSHDQFLLYDLIWKRFIASQMNPAIYDTISADIEASEGIVLRTTGSVIKFNGFLALYEEKRDEEEKEEDAHTLPPLQEGQDLTLIRVNSEQSFTKPPPRYSEASLVKELEKSGIGRPSTYASIMNKIQSREYTVKENQRLKPTELGKVIAEFLESNFQEIMNIGFTAQMEDALELIAANKKEWKELIRDFWGQFIPKVEIAEKEAFIPKIDTDIACPKCKEGHLQKIWAKSRYFYGCSRYPDCDYRASLEELHFNKEEYAPDFDWDQACPVCGGGMKIRHGRYGPFLGCLRYPDCKGIIKISKKGEQVFPTESVSSCPAIGCDGKILSRRSRFGKIFYSCSNFPECDVAVNNISDLESKYQNHPKTPYQKKKFKGGKAKLSPELEAVVGVKEASRNEVIKKLWEYIKRHHLQDPENKRKIIPDKKLAAVFGSDEPIDMFQLAGTISRHLHSK